MKNFPSLSKPANLRDSLHQHLHMYALAATAAGVSVLAMAEPGEAEIVYTPVQVTIGANQSYGLDLTQDGNVDFTIKYHTRATTSGWYGYLFVAPKAGNAVAGHLAAWRFPWAYAIGSGMKINNKARHFIPRRASMNFAVYNWAGTYRAGSWFGASNQGVSNRYLGLKFKIDGQVHYGWARLSVKTYYGFTVTLTGYAYETIANKGIAAGQEQGNDNDKDEGVAQPGPAALTTPASAPTTLGILALGSPALSMWRRKESALESN